MHELQSILLKKIPRLGELTFGCEVQITGHLENPRILTVLCTDPEVKCIYNGNIEYLDWQYKILGHPFSHSDLLEALGEDWAMTGDYQIMRKQWLGWQEFEWLYYKIDAVGELENYPKLPKDLHDLSLPEYEETRKQLIQLLMK